MSAKFLVRQLCGCCTPSRFDGVRHHVFSRSFRSCFTLGNPLPVESAAARARSAASNNKQFITPLRMSIPMGSSPTLVSPTLIEKTLREVHKTAYLMGGSGVQENPDITYSVVPKTQSENISQFLVRYYHHLEPMTVALGMPIEEIGGWFRRFIRKAMYASVAEVSVQAIDEKEKKRVGVLSSIVIDPVRSIPPNMFQFVDPDKQPVNMVMREFYEKLETGLTEANYGSKDKDGRPVKTLEHMFMSTSPEYASRGISRNMVALSEAIASTIINCRVGYVVATSDYSHKVFTKRGYQTLREIKYKDYTNSNGEKIFADKMDKLHPHTCCRAMSKQFNDHYA